MKSNKPIDIAQRLRKKYQQDTIDKMPKETWLNVKSICYTALIGLVVTFVIIGGVVLIPLAILLLIGTVLFIFVKLALSEKTLDSTDTEEEGEYDEEK